MYKKCLTHKSVLQIACGSCADAGDARHALVQEELDRLREVLPDLAEQGTQGPVGTPELQARSL